MDSSLNNMSANSSSTIHSVSSSDNFSTKLYTAMGIILSLTGIFGALFNGLVIVTIQLCKDFKSHTFFLIQVLCVSQLLISILGNPLSATAAFSHGWIFGSAGCDYYGFIMTVLGLFSINILTTISVERFVTICFPLKKIWINSRSITFAIIISFIAAALWGIFPLVGWSRYTVEGIGVGCCPTMSKVNGVFSYTVSLICFQAILPIIIFIFCYSYIIKKVRTVGQTISQQVSRNDKSSVLMRRENKVALSIALSIVAFLASWTPYTVTSILFEVYPLSPLALSTSALVAKCSTIWNPVIYMASNPKFRAALVRVITHGKFGHYENTLIERTVATTSRFGNATIGSKTRTTDTLADTQITQNGQELNAQNLVSKGANAIRPLSANISSAHCTTEDKEKNIKVDLKT